MGVIQDAVHLEEKAERNYREAAKQVGYRGAKILFGLLADAEAAHAATLREWSNTLDLEGPDLIAAARAWVKEAIEGGSAALSNDVRALDILRRAMDLERETETFYRHHAERSADVRTREVLIELAGVEHNHYTIVSSLVEHYNRPSEWVESAEFGLRPDY